MNPEIVFGVNVALVPLAYDAVRVMVSPAEALVVFAVSVQEAQLLGPSVPVQSILQCPGVPLSSPSSQTSSGTRDRLCRSTRSPSTSIPSVSSSSMTPSPHLAT